MKRAYRSEIMSLAIIGLGVVLVLISFAFIAMASAAPPAEGSAQDLMTRKFGEQRTEFFKNFQQFHDDGSPGPHCCGEADCRITHLRQKPGADMQMQVWYGREQFAPAGTDQWVDVPPEALRAHSTIENPFPDSVACVVPGDHYYGSPEAHSPKEMQQPVVLCVSPSGGI